MMMGNDDSSAGNRPLFFRWSGNDNADEADRVRRGIEGFNDLAFYSSLCQEDGVIRVDLHRVNCYYSNVFHGLQAIYRLTFRDGTTKERSAPFHENNHENYYWGRGAKLGEVQLSLDNGERLVDLRLNQGDVVDGIHFITTHRTIFFGGTGGSQVILPPPRKHQHIVAFAGTSLCGAVGRIGCFTSNDFWACRGPLVMLRWLYQQGRASPRPLKGKAASGPAVKPRQLIKQGHFSPRPIQGTQDELAAQAVICLEAEDVWQNIISYI